MKETKQDRETRNIELVETGSSPVNAPLKGII